MKMYVVEVSETAHWEFHIEADDEDDARNRVDGVLDASRVDPLHYDREVSVHEVRS